MRSFVRIAFSAALMSTSAGEMLAYCGRHSIAIYLAFALFMAPVRTVMVRLAGPHIGDIGDFVAIVIITSTRMNRSTSIRPGSMASCGRTSVGSRAPRTSRRTTGG